MSLGPIPPDPDEDFSLDSDEAAGQQKLVLRPSSRNSGEGKRIALRHKDGVVGNLLLQLNGIQFGVPHKGKNKPRNHLADNVRLLREIQRHNRERRQEEVNRPVKALWRSKKYSAVPPKVTEYMVSPPPHSDVKYRRAHSSLGLRQHPVADKEDVCPDTAKRCTNVKAPTVDRTRLQDGNYQASKDTPSGLRRCASAAELRRSSAVDTCHAAVADASATNLPHPSAKLDRLSTKHKTKGSAQDIERDDNAQSLISKSEMNIEMKRPIDFIKLNALAAGHHPRMQRSQSVTVVEQTRRRNEERLNKFQQHIKGSIPKYLVDRRKQWMAEDEKRRAEMPDPSVPPGHKLMPNSERLETLNMLKKTHSDMMEQLHCLPVSSDSLKVRRYKENLDKKLTEVDEAIKIFSRPKVFIKLDE